MVFRGGVREWLASQCYLCPWKVMEYLTLEAIFIPMGNKGIRNGQHGFTDQPCFPLWWNNYLAIQGESSADWQPWCQQGFQHCLPHCPYRQTQEVWVGWGDSEVNWELAEQQILEGCLSLVVSPRVQYWAHLLFNISDCDEGPDASSASALTTQSWEGFWADAPELLCSPSEGPGQVGEMGRKDPSEIQQRQVQGPDNALLKLNPLSFLLGRVWLAR